MNEIEQGANIDEKIISLRDLKETGHEVKNCPSASLIDLSDGVFCCEFHTKMNVLNSELIDFIHTALAYVAENGVGMVFGNEACGTPGAFSAGANLVEVATLVTEGKFTAISILLQNVQGAMQSARYSPFPVVAAPYGLALGGGCEVCIGSDRMVVHSALNMGLVEMGVGLLPSGCGNLNLWKRVIGAIPESVKNIDLGPFFMAVFLTISTGKVSKSAADARSTGFLGPVDRIVFDRAHLIGEAKREVLKMVGDGYVPPTKQKVKVMGKAAQPLIDDYLREMKKNEIITDYQAFLASRVGYVISGGDVERNSEVEEELILKLEETTFIDLLKEKKTLERIEHMLKTGKPLKN
ncbi:MAG: enoyl-CoA hydratase/isomerase family protein [Pseudomonadota bacterium]